MDEFEEFSESMLRESYSDMARVMLNIEDQGWTLLGLNTPVGDSFSLEELHSLSDKLTEKCDGNPLLKRGFGLRSSYVFGKGVSFEGFSAKRVENLVYDIQNQQALFSAEAMIINERSNFTSGQFFILGDNVSKKLQRIPFKEITGWVTDPDDSESMRFVRRSWSRIDIDGKSSTVHEWYPVDTYEPGQRVRTIQKQPVNYGKTMFPFTVNRRSGSVWGVPDAFAAYPWAYAYNDYLKDGARILKALSMFAWSLKTKSKAGSQAAAASIATPQSAGSTAIIGDGMELSALPRSGGGVDLGNGRPLASMVASALEVSVVALMSDPGTSGAYGVAQTLDVPTLKAMQARQKLWELYLDRIFRFFGDKKVAVKWPKMESESSYRQLQSLALAKESGAIWMDEFRNSVLDELDIVALHTEAPDDGMSSTSSSQSAVPSQGNSGAVGSMQDNTNDIRTMDNQPTA